jgi:hypothetical protein
MLGIRVPGLNIEASTALLLSLIGYATSLAWSLIGGLVYVTQRDKQHLQEIEQESAAASDGSELPG